MKYLDVRVRGHSRFLRRRGDFVDLHFNLASSFFKFVSMKEEKLRLREKKTLLFTPTSVLLLLLREREREDKDRPRKNDGVQRIFDDDDDGFSTNGFESF